MPECVGCDCELAYKALDDLCNTCLKARELYENGNIPPLVPKLKLFKVTIPSQTISEQANRKGTKKVMVGKIKPYGYISAREIIVLGTDVSKILDQCLYELGCVAQEVDINVEEIKGPFEHGFVISNTR